VGASEESPAPDDEDDGGNIGVGVDFIIADAEAVVTIVDDDGEGPADLITTILGPAQLNPQTGLFEQTVQVRNAGGTSVPAVRVTLAGLPTTVKVFNAAGEAGGAPYVESRLPLAGGATVDLRVEYFVSSRQTPPDPIVSAASVEPQTPASSAGAAPPVSRVFLQQDRILIEWEATTGSRYAVEYGTQLGSINAADWKRAVPEIVAPANRVQWFDDGPPKTESVPLSATNRFYRVILLPANTLTADRITR
jgi:hypothetical protein